MRIWPCAALLAASLVNGEVSAQVVLNAIHLQAPNNSVLTPEFLLSATVEELSRGLRNGHFSSVELTQLYLERIQRTSHLKTFLFVSPFALIEASEADARLSQASIAGTQTALSPLLGIPYALKGNIAMPPHIAPNTAGSFAFLRTTARMSATVEQQLRTQGAVLLGATNLDEFAQSKSINAPWGWSTLGGQMDSPFHHGGDVCGSSAGSAIATSLGLAAFTLGTQTGWSITCPASRAGVVGFKPSPGAIDRTGIIPISKHRDSVGPITRSVRDAILIYDALSEEAVETLCSPKRRWRIGVAENTLLMPGQGKMQHDMIKAQNRLIEALDGLDNVDIRRVNYTANAVQRLERFDRIDSIIVAAHDFRMGIKEYLSSLDKSSGLSTLYDIQQWHLAHATISLPDGPFPPHGFHLRHDVHEGSYATQDNIDFSVNLTEPIGYKNATYRDALEAVRGAQEETTAHFQQNEIDLVLSLSADGGEMAQFQAVSRAPMLTVPLGFLSSTVAADDDKAWPVYPYPDMPYGIAISGLPGHENDGLCFAEIVERMVAKIGSLDASGSGAGPGTIEKHLREDVLSQLEAAHTRYSRPSS